MIDRAKRLSVALAKLGVAQRRSRGDLLLEPLPAPGSLLGIPTAGGVLHTLNLRLHPNDLTYIASHAGDKVALVDDVLWPLFDKFRATRQLQARDRRSARPTSRCPRARSTTRNCSPSTDPRKFTYPDLDERQAATMCYTSGTTGMPKGVLASHRAIVLHSLASGMVDTLGLRARRQCWPWCRCSTPTPGACRSPACWSAPSRSSPARTSIRPACWS